jgi:adenine-specific DNA-methyltransferase
MPQPTHSESASSYTRSRAGKNRVSSATPEQILWSLLRDRRLAGVKFRRQHPIGPYVVGFFAPSHGLVVEVDDQRHDEQGASEVERQRYLEKDAQLRLCRVRSDDLVGNLESVITGLFRAIGIAAK